MEDSTDLTLQELYSLLTLDIPEALPRELGFLDVVGHTTRETAICNVYRYFLDPALSPQLSRLMMAALVALIIEKYAQNGVKKEQDLSNYEVILERATGKGRIDIVIESKATQSVVIIEVKVYHWLHNDLEDYWWAFEYPEPQKAGIVLSLDPMTEGQINYSNFISITHSEWLNKVCSLGLPVSLPIKDFVYFNDFVNNMNRLTNSHQMNDSAEFYIKHSQKIKKAIKTQESAYSFVVQSIERVAAHFGWIAFGKSSYWRNLWNEDAKETVYLTAYPETIADEEGKVRLILEIYGAAVPYENELRKHIPDYMVSEHWSGGGKMHLTSMTYQVPLDDISKLSEKIIGFIEKDFEPVRQEMLSYLKDKNAHQHK
ncbi:MAG: hypothetical protein ACI923_001612 [Flavobacteriales bacterium]|jgi:hypothetical protein